jgi:hypothetical protein
MQNAETETLNIKKLNISALTIRLGCSIIFALPYSRYYIGKGESKGLF